VIKCGRCWKDYLSRETLTSHCLREGHAVEELAASNQSISAHGGGDTPDNMAASIAAQAVQHALLGYPMVMAKQVGAAAAHRCAQVLPLMIRPHSV